jgi:hypothetical protein
MYTVVNMELEIMAGKWQILPIEVQRDFIFSKYIFSFFPGQSAPGRVDFQPAGVHVRNYSFDFLSSGVSRAHFPAIINQSRSPVSFYALHYYSDRARNIAIHIHNRRGTTYRKSVHASLKHTCRLMAQPLVFRRRQGKHHSSTQIYRTCQWCLIFLYLLMFTSRSWY